MDSPLPLYRQLYYTFYPNQFDRTRIDIYDFAMHHVITLERGINISNEDIIIWNGRNDGRKVTPLTIEIRRACHDVFQLSLKNNLK